MAANLTSETGLHRVLRLRYRACWDAYQRLAYQNAELFSSGHKPSEDQLLEEKEAAAAVQKAREDLLAVLRGPPAG
jgi:hypothetical protein